MARCQPTPTPARVFDHPGRLGAVPVGDPPPGPGVRKCYDDDISACRLVSARPSSSRAATGHPAVADRPSLVSRYTWSDAASGNSGKVTLTRVFESNGMMCHALRYAISFSEHPVPQEYNFNWCCTCAGQWKIAPRK